MKPTAPLPPPRRPGRPRNLEASRSKLLEAALPAFAQFGFDGVSLRSIAATVGFDVSMIAHHFGSKEELWQAVVSRVHAEWEAYFCGYRELMNDETLPLATRMDQVLDKITAHLIETPEVSMFVSREMWYPSERQLFLEKTLLRPHMDMFAPFWQRIMAHGLIRPSDPVLFHIGLFGALSMILAARPILGRLGTKEMDIEQIKEEIRRGLLCNFRP